MKIIYIMGKSSVGKDTIYKKLKDKLNVNCYVLYTTRPVRTGEINGIDYNFVTEENLKEYNENMIESRTYNTVYGLWTYATIADKQFDSDKDLLMTGTLESYSKIKDFFVSDKTKELIPVYIQVEDGVRLERALNRERQQENPKYEELCRRFLADAKDFSEENILKAGINVRFENMDIDECVNSVLTYITSEKQ